MKFAHLADCHIGSWRDPKLAELSTLAFLKAMDECLARGVDFILISGDLFNTSLPSIDRLKLVTKKLKDVKDKGVNVYVIAGSHDFSPSGKTILDVIENAGLFTNVVKGEVVDDMLKLKFTVDVKTGAKITGMLGKKGMLEKSYYEKLDKKNLEAEEGYKIFMFHTAISEFKPVELEKMDSSPLSLLPKGFNYYAGGHVHYIFDKREREYGLITYPGALFPNNFAELQKYGHGGFYIVEDDNSEYVPVKLYDTLNIEIDCEHKTPEQVERELLKEIKGDIKNKIVIIRLSGVLESGRTADVGFRDIFERLYDKGAYFVMKNTSQMRMKDLDEIKVDTSNVEEVEDRIIKEHLGQIKVDGVDIAIEEDMTKKLMKILDGDKQEGERNVDFEKRVLDDLKAVIHSVD